MTRQEAEKIINNNSMLIPDNVMEAIEVLVNDNAVLENIKAEIENLKPTNPNFRHYEGETRAINNVLEIIPRNF